MTDKEYEEAFEYPEEMHIDMRDKVDVTFYNGYYFITRDNKAIAYFIYERDALDFFNRVDN